MSKELKPCPFCGGKLDYAEPSYIPIGSDEVLEIIDQTCPKCCARVINENQKKRLIKNQELHNKLCE